MSADDFIGGHSILALERFMDDTRHMIIFDVLSWKSPVGEKDERLRLFLSDMGYAKAQASEKRGEIKIRKHAAVIEGHTMLPCVGTMWAITVLFEKLLFAARLNHLLVIPGILVSNTPLWLAYPYCYSGYLVSCSLQVPQTMQRLLRAFFWRLPWCLCC